MTHALGSSITSPWEPGREDESAVVLPNALSHQASSGAAWRALQKGGAVLEPMIDK